MTGNKKWSRWLDAGHLNDSVLHLKSRYKERFGSKGLISLYRDFRYIECSMLRKQQYCNDCNPNDCVAVMCCQVWRNAQCYESPMTRECPALPQLFFKTRQVWRICNDGLAAMMSRAHWIRCRLICSGMRQRQLYSEKFSAESRVISFRYNETRGANFPPNLFLIPG